MVELLIYEVIVFSFHFGSEYTPQNFSGFEFAENHLYSICRIWWRMFQMGFKRGHFLGQTSMLLWSRSNNSAVQDVSFICPRSCSYLNLSAASEPSSCHHASAGGLCSQGLKHLFILYSAFLCHWSFLCFCFVLFWCSVLLLALLWDKISLPSCLPLASSGKLICSSNWFYSERGISCPQPASSADLCASLILQGLWQSDVLQQELFHLCCEQER